MFKQLLLVTLLALALSQNLCPTKVVQACEKDLSSGTHPLTQPINNVNKLPKKKDKIRLLTSTALNSC